MTDERKDSLPDEEFEAYLEGRSKVSQGYRRLRDIEPPPELDQAVLREARAAARPSVRRGAFRSAWLPRLAVAATLLVAVGVALQFGDEPLDMLSGDDSMMTDAPVARSPMHRSRPPEMMAKRSQSITVTASPPERAAGGRSDRIEETPSSIFLDEESGQMSAGENEADSAAMEQEATGETGTQQLAGETRLEVDRLEVDRFEFYQILPDVNVTDEWAWPQDLEFALRYRLGVETATDDAERDRIDDQVRKLMAYLNARSNRVAALLAKPPSDVRPPPRDEWIALIDALLDAGYGVNAWQELLLFVDEYPDYPLDERQLSVMNTGGVLPSQ